MSENNATAENTEETELIDSASIPTDADASMPIGEQGGSMITDAAKLIRLGTMTQSLMTEARGAPLDEAGRVLLARIHGETMEALKETMSKDLLDELAEFQLCIDCGDTPPTESELRIAQAQLVGWLQGLHQGFQAMAMAQQAAAMQQLQQLQSGGPPPHAPPAPGEAIDAASRPGTYL
ncbi:MAG: DUF2587 domain-containing protein [Acidimicrobiales bacterium]|nr:DUF2587 domain-containing protein [Acidimicrobiales bacterium]RZV48547.1 MAG: DUF2587 domain-containing protein [Acidimicrobiales bacterium]